MQHDDREKGEANVQGNLNVVDETCDEIKGLLMYLWASQEQRMNREIPIYTFWALICLA